MLAIILHNTFLCFNNLPKLLKPIVVLLITAMDFLTCMYSSTTTQQAIRKANETHKGELESSLAKRRKLAVEDPLRPFVKIMNRRAEEAAQKQAAFAGNIHRLIQRFTVMHHGRVGLSAQDVSWLFY